MAKGHGKSSATSATRKKHAKKTGGPAQDEPPPPREKKEKAKGKGKKAEPRVKMYIPPVKPAPMAPDPLETTGLAHTLPPELLVVLRNLAKKAQVTKVRALEELQTAWIDRAREGGEDGAVVYTLVEMLPVWLHHVPALFVHPSRRVRALAAGLHASLFTVPQLRAQLVFLLAESTPADQLESVLGTWALAAHDVDRAVAAAASRAWKDAVSLHPPAESDPPRLTLTPSLLASLASFVQRTALDPAGVYTYLNPPAPAAPTPAARRGVGARGPGGPRAGISRASATPVRGTLDLESGEQTPRTKAEEFEESEQDRKARLRIGAFGAVRYVLECTPTLTPPFTSFFSSPFLWSALHHAQTCPYAPGLPESFGFAQPNVRKAAWGVVQALLAGDKEDIRPLVPVLSTAVLRSAWVEADTNVQGAMWGPVLTFLKEFPDAWEIDRASQLQRHKDNEDEEEDEEDEEQDSDEEQEHHKPPPPPPAPRLKEHDAPAPSEAYQEFLQFLQLGCSGSPLQGYPTVLIVLSTIPSSILASPSREEVGEGAGVGGDAEGGGGGEGDADDLARFFASFWAAVDGRALSSLQRAATSAAFLSALLECLVFLLRRMLPPSPSPSSSRASPPQALTLTRAQFTQTWTALTSTPPALKLDPRAAARVLVQTLEALWGLHPGLFRAGWRVIREGVREAIGRGGEEERVGVVIKVVWERLRKGEKERLEKRVEGEEGTGCETPGEAAERLLADILETAVVDAEGSLKVAEGGDGEAVARESFELLVSLLRQFKKALFYDEEFSERLDKLITEHAYLLASTCPSLLLAYLAERDSLLPALAAWHALLAGLAAHPASLPHTLPPFLAAARARSLPRFLKPFSNELDTPAQHLLAGSAADLALVRQLILAAEHFLSPVGFLALLHAVSASFVLQVDLVLGGDEPVMFTFAASLELLEAVFEHPMVRIETALEEVLPSLCVYAYLLPECDGVEEHASFGAAAKLWARWLEGAGEEQRVGVVRGVKGMLKKMMGDTDGRALPEDILRMLAKNPPGLQDLDVLADLFPSPEELDAQLMSLSPDAIDSSLGVVNPLIPPTQSIDTPLAPTADRHGFSSYARVTQGLLQAFSGDRQLARQHLWALRHFLALSIYAHDFQSVPAKQSPVFTAQALVNGLSDLIVKVHQITTYLLYSSADGNKWRVDALNAASAGTVDTNLAPLSKFLVDTINFAKDVDATRDTRILKTVLEHLLDDVEQAEADSWVMFARKLERSAPQTSMTILAAIVDSSSEPQRLDRYRNELAAALLGIPSSRANTEGLLTLRELAATAPNPESDVAFLPQLRAVNAVKACQDWISSDNDVDEEVESAMMLFFIQLAPILQNVPGGHWEFIFDVLESNLENSRITEDDTLVALSRSLKLIIAIQDLCSTNKSLRADWQERKLPILTMVRDLATVPLDSVGASVPRSVCRELVLSIVQDLPPSLIDHETLPKMCHLVTDPSSDVQKMAYQLLHTAAKKRTEHLVIEAGVDSEATVVADLPIELLDILQRNVNFSYANEEEEQTIFGYLLSWMLLFDLFQDASFKVRASYIDQLRSLDVIVSHFIPCFLSLLHLDEGLNKAFKLDIWAVDEYYVELYEPGTGFAIPLLAAHLYYRTLLTIPSLIHTCLLDSRDRQLISAITTYTSQYISPVIIRAELAHVKSPAALAELADDNLSVKVASAVNEVLVSYLVDEHQLEIKLKIPSDWPLHRIEVKDLKRVGVDENRWRAWILAVQQTIWSHNGRIVDGLSLFKKNITLHFEGQVECAICYSIISVMDGSLPRKPCKTCKNRFHAGCLYKWFNTSHSSSCPLCRSDII